MTTFCGTLNEVPSLSSQSCRVGGFLLGSVVKRRIEEDPLQTTGCLGSTVETVLCHGDAASLRRWWILRIYLQVGAVAGDLLAEGVVVPIRDGNVADFVPARFEVSQPVGL